MKEATEERFGEQTNLPKPLGRLVAFDINDMEHRMKSILPKKTAGVTQRYWNANGWWGHQGDLPHCVGYAWAHWLEDGPVTQLGTPPILHPSNEIYHAAQRIDEWPGEAYDGTSVRAGAKVLMAAGLIDSYNWAWDLDTMVHALLTAGPVVVGTNWYEEMFYPKNGVIKIGGAAVGGHAYVVNGVNTKTKTCRIKNSWGREWGNKGHVNISFANMERLIAEYGEVCLAIERKRA